MSFTLWWKPPVLGTDLSCSPARPARVGTLLETRRDCFPDMARTTELKGFPFGFSWRRGSESESARLLKTHKLLKTRCAGFAQSATFTGFVVTRSCTDRLGTDRLGFQDIRCNTRRRSPLSSTCPR